MALSDLFINYELLMKYTIINQSRLPLDTAAQLWRQGRVGSGRVGSVLAGKYTSDACRLLMTSVSVFVVFPSFTPCREAATNKDCRTDGQTDRRTLTHRRTLPARVAHADMSYLTSTQRACLASRRIVTSSTLSGAAMGTRKRKVEQRFTISEVPAE